MSEDEPARPVVVEGDGADLAVLEAHGLVAVAKPPGLPVIAARGQPAELCLQRRCEARLGRRLWVVHRIDRDVSGVVLFATNSDAHRRLSLAFEHRRVVKSYRAFVAGRLVPPHGRLDRPLHAARKGKTRPAGPGEAGQSAITDYAVRASWIRSGEMVSLVELLPQTGRHHQIRVHLRSADAPILFDPLYARGRTPASLAVAPCRRLALHALRIEVPSADGGGVAVEAPLAPDLAALERWLAAWGAPAGAAGGRG